MSVYGILVYLHVLSAFAFILVHGVSAVMSFQIRHETNSERLRALTALSANTSGLLYGSLGVLLLTGIAAGIMGAHWGSGWIWLSLVLLVATVVVMSLFAMRQYTPLRMALGLPYFDTKPRPALPPESDEKIQARVRATTPHALAGIGIVAVAVILWLMLFKPF